MIARTAQFQPKPGFEETVLQTLRSHLAFTASFPGCLRAYLGTPIHGRHILVYSEWVDESAVERFEAALRSDPDASAGFFSILGRLVSPAALALYTVSP